MGQSWSYDPEFVTEVELTFTPLETGGTRVRLEHRNLERYGGADAQKAAEQIGDGWPRSARSSAISTQTSTEGGSEMSHFIVHTIPGSPFARAVCATLEEKAATWRIAPISPGAHKQEEHLSRHPFGRMPVLEHDGFLLYETQAILRYLDRILVPVLTPGDPRAAARMDQVMNVHDWYLFQGCANIIAFQRVVGPRVMGLTPDEAAIAEAMPRAHVVFAELSRLLGDKPYFAGDHLSLADLLVGPQLDFLSLAPEWEALTASSPNLVDWLARLNARPSMQATTWANISAKAA